MILGENSTGKSSALSAIALALIGRREATKLRKYVPGLVRSAGVDRFDQLDEPRVEASIDFHFSKHIAHFLYDPVRRAIDGTDEPATIVLGYGTRRFFDLKKRRHAEGAAARIRTLFSHLPLFRIPATGFERKRVPGLLQPQLHCELYLRSTMMTNCSSILTNCQYERTAG